MSGRMGCSFKRGREGGLQSLETVFCLVICSSEGPIQVMGGGVEQSGHCNFRFNNTL